MNVLDLFSGIGGFSIGLECAGMKTVAFCEIDSFCRKVLKEHWPNVPIFEDIRMLLYEIYKISPVELICGGDPCPIRSKARSIWGTKKPDLSGFFLALVERCRPRWVVRENVPASDDVDFYTCLEMLGYRTIIVATNSAKITAQNRERDLIVGCNSEEKLKKFINKLPIAESDKRYTETKYQAVQAYPVLTTHPCRWDAWDGYIWDGTGLRVADSEERQKLAGFPSGWLDGISKTQVARMTGNAVVPQIVEIIGRAIMEGEMGNDS